MPSNDPFDEATPGPRRSSAAGYRPTTSQAEESLLGAMLLSRDAIAAAAERGHRRRLLQAGARAHLRRHQHPHRARRAGRPGHRRRRAAPRRPARGHRRPVGAARACRPPRRPPPTPAATPRSSRSTRCCGGSSASAGEIAELGYGLPDDVTKTRRRGRVDGVRRRPAPRHRLDRRAPRPARPTPSTASRSSTSGARPSPARRPATPTSTSCSPACSPSALIVVGARPAMGKTAFALGMAAHAAMQAQHARCCSSRSRWATLELTQRLLCAEARVDSTQHAQRQAAPRQRLDEDQPRHRPPGRGAAVASTTTRTSRSWRSGPRPGG